MQGSIGKYCALAAVLTVLGAPLSAYAAAGKGGSSPDCPTKDGQTTSASNSQSCDNSKSPSSGGAAGNGG